MIRPIILAIVVALSGIGFGSYGLWDARRQAVRVQQYKGIATELESQLWAAQGALEAVRTQVPTVQASAVSAATDIQRGLDANETTRQWGSTAVPDPIRDGLCKHVRCKQAK